MAKRHAEAVARGREVADELRTLISAAYAEVARRVAAEPDPVARARAITSLVRASDEAFAEHLAPLRGDAVRAMRFPDGYAPDTVPAASWWEIGEAIGTNGNRAFQIAELPADRSAPQAGPKPGGARKSSVEVGEQPPPPDPAPAAGHPGRTASCGTLSGYVAHLSAREEPDAACRAAWAAWFSERYASDPTYRTKKLQLNAERAQALNVLAATHPEQFRRCWHEQQPGDRRNRRALEELRKQHQTEFDTVLADIRGRVAR